MADHTFLFADLAGYTALTEAHGDDEAAELVGSFCAAVDDLLPPRGGHRVKSIGDAVMLRVESAAAGVELGLDIVDRVGSRHEFPAVRVGMHTGSAVERDGDWFGAAVNLAARVAGLASGREVLLTEESLQGAGALPDVETSLHGRHEVRNVSRPVTVYAARRAGARSGDGLPIDPVCRMALDPPHAVGTLTHGRRTFYFCSLRCAGTFAADPDRYVLAHG